MPRCEVCHNEYDKAFTVIMADRKHVFDSFECAIHKLAPRCASCGCTIIGHGVEGEQLPQANVLLLSSLRERTHGVTQQCDVRTVWLIERSAAHRQF